MFLVFDIGGTNTRIATSDGQTLLDKKVIPTTQNFEEFLLAFTNAANKIIQGKGISAVAGGIRGVLNPDKSQLIKDTILLDWINKPLRKELEKILKISVHLENDAALAGLGEATSGSGKGFNIVAYLTISTGVGGVKIENGKIDQNSLGFEPGKQIINGKTLEELISGNSLKNQYGKSPEEIKDPEIWNEVAKNLSLGLNNILVTWSPDIVILGGGVTDSIPLGLVEENLKQIVTAYLILPKVKKASLGDEAGLLGALKYIQDQ